jgi:hypothetical protein
MFAAMFTIQLTATQAMARRLEHLSASSRMDGFAHFAGPKSLSSQKLSE